MLLTFTHKQAIGMLCAYRPLLLSLISQFVFAPEFGRVENYYYFSHLRHLHIHKIAASPLFIGVDGDFMYM